MSSVTLMVSLVFSAAALILPAPLSVSIYVGALVSYPNYVKMNLAGLDFTVMRVVILAVLLRSFIAACNKPLRIRTIDWLVLLVFIAELAAGLATAPSFMDFMINRAGATFDMLLPYIAFRLAIRNRSDLQRFLIGALILMIPTALLGVYQCFTAHNFFAPLESLVYWNVRPSEYGKRFGLTRSNVVFSHPIIFGLIYAMFIPLFLGIRKTFRQFGWLWLGGVVLIMGGVFASVSSGTYLALFMAMAFIVGYRFRRYWKPVVIFCLLCIIVVDIISNRNWYHVLSEFTLNKRTAWYRGRLMEVAIFEGGMSGHWAAGYGYGQEPGWGAKIDGRDYTDMVNHYLLVLSRHGLVGFAAFAIMNVWVLRHLVRAWKRAQSESDRQIVWGLSASFFALALSSFSVSLEGPPSNVYFLMIAMAAALPDVLTPRRPLPSPGRKQVISQQVEKGPNGSIDRPGQLEHTSDTRRVS
ncbi:MAG: hypothetical protein LLF76_13195 [Planctomycetaceae bacterium]|nr:hypothetical protein [Planctomycetaceae bacterium]